MSLVQVGPGDGAEIAPLLDPEMQATASGPSDRHGDIWMVTPLPKRQVAVLSFAALSEPVNVNVVYPFVFDMLRDLSTENIAHRVGLLFGCFAFAQFSAVYFWGSLSDRIGRKPVLLACLLLGAASTIAFGTSASFLQMVIFRSITGATYGDVPVLRSAMGDITDSTNQARAFSFIPLAWAISSTVAPLIGGFLNHPAERFEYFRHSTYFREHPYALPCFTAAVVSSLGFLLVALLLRETLVERHGDPSVDTKHVINLPPATDSVPNYGTTASVPQSSRTSERSSSPTSRSPVPSTDRQHDFHHHEPEIPVPVSNHLPRPSAIQILRDRVVRTVLFSYGFLSIISTSNDVIFAMWMFMPIKNGGLGLESAQIATVLSIGSILSTLAITFLFPLLHRHFGTIRIYRYAMSLDFVLVLLYPIVSATAAAAVKHAPRREGFGDEKGNKGGVWEGIPLSIMIGLGTMLVVKAGLSLTWGCNMILVTASAPHPRALGAVNSLAQIVASLARAIGPPIYTTIFALSLGTGHILGGKLPVWVFMALMALCSLAVSFRVEEGKQEWRNQRSADASGSGTPVVDN